MDMRKFGAYISKLRKGKDLTQSQLSDMLNVTRQAVSKWEMGDSFPDISLLPQLASIFNISVDELLSSGELHNNENTILLNVANDNSEKVAQMLHNNELSVESVVNVAPLLKASVLDSISKGLSKHGIDIKHIVELSKFMNDSSLTELIKNASYDKLDEELLSKFIPFLNRESKEIIFSKIIDKELSVSLLPVISPYADDYMKSQIEAAIVDGQFGTEVLRLLYTLDN